MPSKPPLLFGAFLGQNSLLQLCVRRWMRSSHPWETTKNKEELFTAQEKASHQSLSPGSASDTQKLNTPEWPLALRACEQAYVHAEGRGCCCAAQQRRVNGAKEPHSLPSLLSPHLPTFLSAPLSYRKIAAICKLL